MADIVIPDPISGSPGELINRLFIALAPSVHAESVAVVRLGAELGLSIPRPWDPDRYLQQVRRTAQTLLETGVSESFVVRSVRDSATRAFRPADFAAVDENRAALRAQLERVLADESAFAEYRAEVVDKSAAGRNQTDEQVKAQILKLLGSSFVEPVRADEVTRDWADEESWRKACRLYLSEEDIEEWEQRADYMRRRSAD
ncbi:hypothetical protein AB0D74_41075 [Streptomyces sp. NPDC048278]|uniref:hypothetical protein n=1 Tax=Streptomyces sp. NPDC048278 TaxID=3155809 RepID=UPI003446D96B